MNGSLPWYLAWLPPAWALPAAQWAGEQARAYTVQAPVFAPPAPQTEEKLRTWTPEDMFEAIRQQYVARSQAPLYQLPQAGQSQSGASGDSRAAGNLWLWIAAGLGAAGLLLLLIPRPVISLRR